MIKKILLTSFDTWLPHHVSNSSDDLLHEISKLKYISPSLIFLRLLPVNIKLASNFVTTKIDELQPNSIICCGMAERRTTLTVESNASWGDSVLNTGVDLQHLAVGSKTIEVSHDAGKFVCEGLYYSALKYIYESKLNINCLFVHVPILTEKNLAETIADFQFIIHHVGRL